MKAIERRVVRLEAALGSGSSAARQIDLFLEGELPLSDAEFRSLIDRLPMEELDRLTRILEQT